MNTGKSMTQRIIDSAIERDVNSLPSGHRFIVQEALFDVDGEDVGKDLLEKWDDRYGKMSNIVVHSPVDGSPKYIEVIFIPNEEDGMVTVEESVARRIIKLASMGSQDVGMISTVPFGGAKARASALRMFDSTDVGTQVITVPLEGASARGVALLLYGFQCIIDKISVPKRGNEITVVFG